MTAVHSIDRFVFTVPDLEAAQRFYSEFGLDPRRDGGRVDLYAYGHPHRWASIFAAPGRKRLQYLRFGVYADDFAPLLQRLDRLGIATPSRRIGSATARAPGSPTRTATCCRSSPRTRCRRSEPAPQSAGPPSTPAGRGAAPGRSSAARVRPRQLSHVLLFSSDVSRSVRFYDQALGLRLSDRSGDVIAFMHGAHASDHHMLAFAKSAGPGLHHSSWVVASIDEIGLGMQHMADCGYIRGWGVGRHVIGSNYFCYVQDPWGSFAEYSHDIDFVPAELEWHRRRSSARGFVLRLGAAAARGFRRQSRVAAPAA